MEIYDSIDDRSPGDKMVDFGMGFVIYVVLPALALGFATLLFSLLT